MEDTAKISRWKVFAAFAVIYLVWGSTFLAIRVGVREVPPFLLAGMRFVLAGVVLYGWMRMKGTPSPTLREWGAASALAVPIFVLDYGLVFWSERRVPSGVTALMMATIPVFMTLSEIVSMKTQRLTARLVLALSIGILGVGVLVSHNASFGDAPIDAVGAAALMVASVSWSIGSAVTRKLPLPANKAMSSGAQMLVGGVMLTSIALLSGEFRGFRMLEVSAGAWMALVYLIFAGSILAFTAYVWLIHHESPTKVGTYAYVNPVVAVILGYFFLKEEVGLRTICGTVLVLVSVVVITTARSQRDLHDEAALEVSTEDPVPSTEN
ncbi:MAG TPA: EamA family transporter [Candidatus Sulfotelmatobacter sp.]|nr:EamA family transporter [Candidatus Sulfotelmatobacter sp.]